MRFRWLQIPTAWVLNKRILLTIQSEVSWSSLLSFLHFRRKQFTTVVTIDKDIESLLNSTLLGLAIEFPSCSISIQCCSVGGPADKQWIWQNSPVLKIKTSFYLILSTKTTSDVFGKPVLFVLESRSPHIFTLPARIIKRSACLCQLEAKNRKSS